MKAPEHPDNSGASSQPEATNELLLGPFFYFSYSFSCSCSCSQGTWLEHCSASQQRPACGSLWLGVQRSTCDRLTGAEAVILHRHTCLLIEFGAVMMHQLVKITNRPLKIKALWEYYSLELNCFSSISIRQSSY